MVPTSSPRSKVIHRVTPPPTQTSFREVQLGQLPPLALMGPTPRRESAVIPSGKERALVQGLNPRPRSSLRNLGFSPKLCKIPACQESQDTTTALYFSSPGFGLAQGRLIPGIGPLCVARGLPPAWTSWGEIGVNKFPFLPSTARLLPDMPQRHVVPPQAPQKPVPHRVARRPDRNVPVLTGEFGFCVQMCTAWATPHK